MAFELIQKTTIVGSSTAVIEFNTIPSTYKDLRLFMGVRCGNGAAREPLVIAINGDDVNTNFVQYDWYQEDNGNGAEFTSSPAKTRMVAAFSAANAPTYAFGGSELRINDYNNSTNRQAMYTNITHYQNTNPSWDNWGNGNTWYGTAAITTLAFRWYTGANYVADSTISLYGIK